MSTKLYQILSRQLLFLTGTDVYPFLQKLLTNDIEKLKIQDNSILYNCLLNTKGRIVADIFVYRAKNNIFMDCDYSQLDQLLTYFKRYKMRQDIEFHIIDEWKIYQSLFHTKNYSNTDVLVFPDPRAQCLGNRFFVKNIDLYKYNVMHEIDFVNHRYKEGICEGREITGTDAIPHEYNMDILNALSFTKGCYLGQELVTRTQFRGKVRKRVCPFIFENPINLERGDIEIPRYVFSVFNNEIIRSGKLICFNNSKGCVHIKLNAINSEKHYLAVEKDKDMIGIKIFKAKWWPNYM
ncbi:hypothetical protein HZS_5940 [Henneguya salminicola]|nr:hypothetical protein HZS_5940 [Henneguya salminicola]